MNRNRLVMCLTAVGMAASMVIAQPPSSKPADAAKPAAKPAGQPEGMPQLPPGWTPADMQACMEAGTPGSEHAHLAQSAGTWKGKTKMWMGSGTTTPAESECTTVITPIMDGRYVKIETSGDMPGMGPFNGFGINGFDNVSHKYQSTWIDNCGTGIMNGTGQLSGDGKQMTWTYSYNCPIAKKPVTMREIEKFTGKDTMTLEMWSTDPKTNKEYKMMEIAYTRTGAAPLGARGDAAAPATKGESARH